MVAAIRGICTVLKLFIHGYFTSAIDKSSEWNYKSYVHMFGKLVTK